MAASKHTRVDSCVGPTGYLQQFSTGLSVSLRIYDAHCLAKSIGCELNRQGEVGIVGNYHNFIKYVIDAVNQQECCQVHIGSFLFRPYYLCHLGRATRNRICYGVYRPSLGTRDELSVVNGQIWQGGESSEIVVLSNRGLLIVRQGLDPRSKVPDPVNDFVRQEAVAQYREIKPLVRRLSERPVVEVKSIDVYVRNHYARPKCNGHLNRGGRAPKRPRASGGFSSHRTWEADWLSTCNQSNSAGEGTTPRRLVLQPQMVAWGVGRS